MTSPEPVLDDDVLTAFCDHDAKWGPILFLRPRRHERLGVVRTFVMAALPGICLGLLGSILLLLLSQAAGKAAPPVYAFPLALTGIYFLACRLTIVPAWNRRAARISRPE